MLWHAYDGVRLTATNAYVLAAALILGGALLAIDRYASAGAASLAAAYLAFAAYWVHRVVAAPTDLDLYGNFFEELSLLLGAALVLATRASWNPPRIKRTGGVLFALCALSFAMQQARHIAFTASLVPTWLPPGPLFWADATTVAFVAAAIALIIDRSALLASRLTAVMLAGFGILIWLPSLSRTPNDRGDWSETIETFAIVGTAWILCDLLGRKAGRKHRARR